MNTKIYYMHALSPLHVGVGQAIGVVDLPIMRSRSTQLPIVPGSAFKGVLRDTFHGDQNAMVRKDLFGPDTVSKAADSQAGTLVVGDATLLLMPIRSFVGVFAYVTCPFVLSQYSMDCQRSGTEGLPPIPEVDGDNAMTTSGSKVVDHDTVYLEDLDLINVAGADEWGKHFGGKVFSAQSARFSERFIIVSDDTFAFLAETATEIRPRIRINDETGVVQESGLWYEENLPTESVLWGIFGMNPIRRKNGAIANPIELLASKVGTGSVLQIGGKATVGRGLVQIIF